MAKKEILTFQITEDLRNQIKNATDDAIKTALEAVGRQAVSFAVYHATEKGVVDTGLLRNSLTYALAGRPAEKGAYSGTSTGKYGKKEIPHGRYEGSAPDDKEGERIVYIGTNVKYALVNELGGVKHKARPYLRPALEDHVPVYIEIFKKVLSKLG